jgi:pimeloyl-ACP methyl ester carboxylesterase
MARLLLALCLLLAVTPSLALAESREVTTSDGVRLSVDLSGPEAGEPVLLLHGLSASALTNWRLPGIVRALTDAGCRVIAPDQRGHGRSEAAKDGAYGPRMVTDALEVLDALRVERAHVVGYSMGGMIGLRLAAEHPGRVRSLLLGGMGWVEAGGGGQRFFERNATGRAGQGEGVAACAAQLKDLAVSADALAKIDLPVAVVVGELDAARVLVRRLHAARPEWPIQLVPRVGHLTCVASDALRDAIVAHVQRSS